MIIKTINDAYGEKSENRTIFVLQKIRKAFVHLY